MLGANKRSSYEDIRQKRLEENKRRMEELKIPKLALGLLQKPSLPKPSKPSPTQPPELKQVERRCSRFLNKTSPVYIEVTDSDLDRPRRRSSYTRSSNSHSSNRASVSEQDRSNALKRADYLKSKLVEKESKLPCFVKGMLHSHVKVGFWLGLPVQFSKNYLPEYNETITLIDVEDEDKEYQTKYLAQKTGLSGGWRGFALEKDLADGDALVFQLVNSTTFKVYILRLHDSQEQDNDE